VGLEIRYFSKAIFIVDSDEEYGNLQGTEHLTLRYTQFRFCDEPDGRSRVLLRCQNAILAYQE
jgi:hypothetical protein